MHHCCTYANNHIYRAHNFLTLDEKLAVADLNEKLNDVRNAKREIMEIMASDKTMHVEELHASVQTLHEYDESEDKLVAQRNELEEKEKECIEELNRRLYAQISSFIVSLRHY